MGLKNNVNMEFINRIFRNLKAKYISVIDTRGIVGKYSNSPSLLNNSALPSLFVNGGICWCLNSAISITSFIIKLLHCFDTGKQFC